MPAIKQADRIERKDRIPNSERTQGKDQAAEFIQTEIIEQGRWPMSISKMAEESGWSRQHIANTLETYYEEADGQETESEAKAHNAMTLDVPEDVENVDDFFAGVAKGYRLVKESQQK